MTIILFWKRYFWNCSEVKDWSLKLNLLFNLSFKFDDAFWFLQISLIFIKETHKLFFGIVDKVISDLNPRDYNLNKQQIHTNFFTFCQFFFSQKFQALSASVNFVKLKNEFSSAQCSAYFDFYRNDVYFLSRNLLPSNSVKINQRWPLLIKQGHCTCRWVWAIGMKTVVEFQWFQTNSVLFDVMKVS